MKRMMSASGCDSTWASANASSGAAPQPDLPATSISRSSSTDVNVAAAAPAGSSVIRSPNIARSTTSADSGGDSSM